MDETGRKVQLRLKGLLMPIKFFCECGKELHRDLDEPPLFKSPDDSLRKVINTTVGPLICSDCILKREREKDAR